MAKRNIRLTRLYRYLETAPALFLTSSPARSTVANNSAERRMAILAAHLVYLFTIGVRRFQAELEMPAKDTLYPFELLSPQQFCQT
jgi:hypothetical protein